MKSTDITKAYVGSTEVDKIYLGSELVWEPVPPTCADSGLCGDYPDCYECLWNVPLTFTVTSDVPVGYIQAIRLVGVGSYGTVNIEYKLNNNPWTTFTIGSDITVSRGDVVQFRGNNLSLATSINNYLTFGKSSARFTVKGNIMSLLDKTDFASLDTLPSTYTFAHLFDATGDTSGNVYTNIEGDLRKLFLPATSLTEGCYAYMFNGCKYITAAPELPATALAESCYEGMFWYCHSLTVPPPIINAASVPASGCNTMFAYCISMTTAPELPATTLGVRAYNNMFSNCYSLTEMPLLPATNLSERSYAGMFQSCSSLTETSIIPNATPGTSTYSGMFYKCTSLNKITCLVQNPGSAFGSWATQVSPSGVFYKAPGASWQSGANGIPSGWTVVDAQ